MSRAGQLQKARRRLSRKQPSPVKLAALCRPVLYVWTPQGQQHCMGRYRLVRGRAANGWPLWKMCGGSYWLYSGKGGGHWCIGAQDVRNEDFACNAGFLLSERPHGEALPDEVQQWRRWDSPTDRHVADAGVRVTRPGVQDSSAARTFYVSSSSGRHLEVCAGRYELVQGVMANGWPIWRMCGGDYWMYSCRDGCWGLGAKDVRAKGFDCCAGFILSVEPHRGTMPHRVGKWERWDDALDRFLADPSIHVSDVEPEGCWRLATGYCGRALCRAAHEGDVAVLAAASEAALSEVCEVTVNDALCEAAVEGHAPAVARLLLEGHRRGRAVMRCHMKAPCRELSQAVRWGQADDQAPTEDEAAMRFFTETLGRLRAREACSWRCRVAASTGLIGRGEASSGASSGSAAAAPPAAASASASAASSAAAPGRNPLAALPGELFEGMLDFVSARPSTRTRNPVNLIAVKTMMRYVLQNPEVRQWLPLMKKCSSRWHQAVRNWDYFQEEIFFKSQMSSAQLEQDLFDAGVISSASAPRFLGRAVGDARCREMLLEGVPWPPRREALLGGPVVPTRLRALHAWRGARRCGGGGFGPGPGDNFLRALPDICFQAVMDYLVHRRQPRRLPAPAVSRRLLQPQLSDAASVTSAAARDFAAMDV